MSNKHKKHHNKGKDVNKSKQGSKSIINIKYDKKKMDKATEFKTRIMERIAVRVLAILENKRP